jgi:hypothetical protein
MDGLDTRQTKQASLSAARVLENVALATTRDRTSAWGEHPIVEFLNEVIDTAVLQPMGS